MYAKSPEGIKMWMASIASFVMSVNTLHVLTFSFRDMPTDMPWLWFYAVSFIVVCFHFFLVSSLLRSLSRENSVAAEILYDAKAFKTALKMKNYKAALVFANSFTVMYLPALPYAVFVLFYYRRCLTTALDPHVLVADPDPNSCLAMLMHRLQKKNYKSSIIPEDVVEEHFEMIGDTYFIKDRHSASFLRLSYSEQDILEAFGIDREEIFSTMVELSNPGSGMDDSMTNAAIKVAFRLC